MPNEKFSVRKFISGFGLFDLVSWAKALVYTFRTIIILGIVVGLIFGVGYFRGRKNAPVHVDINDTKLVLVDPNGENHELIIKNGVMSFDGRAVKIGDIPSLRPFGIELHPKLAAGITSAGNPAAGLALEVAHAYNLNLDLLAMIPFIGVGISYDIHFDKVIKVDNTSIGLGLGRDLEAGENAAILYMAIEF